MKIESTNIHDTFAEAFDMAYACLIVTAHDDYWLEVAVREATGYSASVIGCDAEAGCEQALSAEQTPDGRPGMRLLFFGRSRSDVEAAILNRVGQCVMTCPTTAVFDGLSDLYAELEIDIDSNSSFKPISLGKQLRYFGDGFQKSKVIGDTRYWRVPVMDGEFLVADTCLSAKGVAGGNLIIEAVDQATGALAARRAAEVVEKMPGVISPFPGGVVRSGSKVGSRYPSLIASTAHEYCPTLRGRVDLIVHPECQAVYEIVIDGVNAKQISCCMTEAMKATAGEGVLAIGAGNYGGKLGKHHFHLHELLKNEAAV